MQQTFDDKGTSFAINTQAEMNFTTNTMTTSRDLVSIFDHIIFPYRKSAQKRWIKTRIAGKSDIVKDVTKKSKQKYGGEEEQIHCQVGENFISDQDFDGLRVKNLKARNLEILLCTLTSNKRAGAGQSLQEFLYVLDGPDNQIDVAMVNDHTKSRLKSPANYPVEIRSRMSVDPTESAICFNYDLVPIIPTILLADLVKGVLGDSPIAKDGTLVVEGQSEADHLPMIKHMIRGLNVHCGYIPQNNSKARLLDENTRSEGRYFQIKDVRFPDKKTEFTADNGITYNIPDYFDNVVLEDRKLQHPDWPVVKDDTGAWIPLEMLYVAPGQVLSRCGRLNEKLIRLAHKYMSNHGEHQLRQYAQGTLNHIADAQVRGGQFKTAWLDDHTLDALKFVSNPDLFPHRKHFTAQSTKSKIALLQIASKGEGNVDNLLSERLETSLNTRYCVSRYYCNEDDILDDSIPFNKMMRGDHQHKLILAVTSETFNHVEYSTQPKQTFARLRSLCELKYGVMLVCQTGTSLAQLYKERKGPEDHFPMGIQRHIDFMLGKSNFSSDVLSTVSDYHREQFMVMGAHIMHKNLHEKNKTKYIPSIAAVVASTNGTALSFPGSARFQRTTAKITNGRRIPENSISDLPDMLVERFEGWADQRAPPKYILFYRDSVSFDDKVVHEECNTIRDAFERHFGRAYRLPLITYIVVSKNAELRYLSHGPDAPLAQLYGDFVIEPGKAKYKYYVVCNESNIHLDNLQVMTRSINDSNQLHPQLDQVAKALPLTWAAKLCQRVFGYVSSANAEDLALAEITRLKRPAQKEIDDEDAAVGAVKHYLRIDSKGPRPLPWTRNLDYSMFYL
ncbi:hypothetical protein DE146DRAFT_236186 [Phaeosphaeria sp. MPI-PUGE-AT-0046c]|nr:hypothetical protein DE146DRAFT_236186 [Phaeosphaeria sp. MPI-PUGE-AT-0046c]